MDTLDWWYFHARELGFERNEAESLYDFILRVHEVMKV